MHTQQDTSILYRMYVFSGISAIGDFPDAEGITLVRTAKGREYRFPFTFDKPFIPQVVAALTEAEDTHILQLIHVWKNHCLDIPSYSLRQALMALHPENKNARLMLAGENSFTILTVSETM